jgi:hypothetical protein
MGMGPMTGRGAGFCAGYAAPGYMNNAPARAFGMRFGRGAGFGWGFHARGFGRRNRFYAGGTPVRAWAGRWNAPMTAPDPEMEKQALKNQAEDLQLQLDAIKKRLEELSVQS